MGIYGDRALELQKEGFSCAQSVVACLCERYGVDRVTALRFAGVFGSGIGLSTETCGVITGAMMLIGLKYGKKFPEDPNDFDSFGVAQEFIKRFKECHGGKFKCRELLGHDASTEEGLKNILDNNLYENVCQKMVYDGADLIFEILEGDAGYKPDSQRECDESASI